MQTHILRAKLMFNKRTYRDIEIPSDFSLYDLGAAIVDAFDFDFDHAFGFYSRLGSDYYRSEVAYELFADLDETAYADDITDRPKPRSVKNTEIGDAFTVPKQKMQFLFDYGDEWLFEIELRGFGETVKGAEYPRVIASKGDAPEQYPDLDDEDDDEDEDDEEQEEGAEDGKR